MSSVRAVSAAILLLVLGASAAAALGVGIVTIDDGPRKQTKKRAATFAFSADDPSATFECRLDSPGFDPCTSPLALRGLERGRHVFEVRALGPDGSVTGPATLKWKIVRKGG